MVLTPDQKRIHNVTRLLEITDSYLRDMEIDIKTMNRLDLSETMFGFSVEHKIPIEHFRQAYSHQVSELNGTPSSILQSNQQNRTMKKEPAPMLPAGLQTIGKRAEPKANRSRTPAPYISPMMQKFMK